ncbi:MAG: hypothetical protein K2K93_03035 [Muribaculaceae bacterium]|nr:hypothetical protein [Muribaculaceae bacterium]
MNAANGRIVRNTGLLYVRLIFLTLVNLYTVRVTLEALGQVDYGIYDVIASVVASLSVLTGAMTSASQRFLSYHLGREDYEQYSVTFSLLLICFIGIALALIAVGEVFGTFFIKDRLTIPPDRLTAAYWVFQASLLSFAFGLITIPYMSSIVANERMDAFAIFSVVEGVLKLGVAIWLVHHAGDRLILYGVLVAVITICVFLMQMCYCHARFKYCRYVWKWHRHIFVELSKYTGWNLFGSVSAILATAGQNILLNIYFGPVINASKAIADKIQHVINGFSINLYMAVSPQIIKSYAAEDYRRAMRLVLMSSKFSFMLIFVLAFPLICNMDAILEFWLGDDSHTPFMAAFSQLILVYCLIFTLESPISRIIQATGNIRRYQMSVGLITISYIPITAGVLYLGATPVMTLVMLMIIMSIAQCVRIYVAHQQVNLPYGEYFRKVLMPIGRVAVTGVPLYWAMTEWQVSGFWASLVLKTAVALIFGVTIAAILGLDGEDRKMMKDFIKSKISRSRSADA